MATSEKQHAEVKQEHRVLSMRIAELWDECHSKEANQLLADYAAEVERKARLDEAQWWKKNTPLFGGWGSVNHNWKSCACSNCESARACEKRIAVLAAEFAAVRASSAEADGR